MKLNDNDLQLIIKRLPKQVRLLLEHNQNLTLAGGFIRSIISHEYVADIDIFSNNYNTASETANEFANDLNVKSYATTNAFTVNCKGKLVQFIHRWVFNEPDDILKHFDFTIAKAAVWYNQLNKTWDSLCHDSYYQDLASKRLIYTYPADPEAGASLLRILKYRAKGYSPTLETLAAVVALSTRTDEKFILGELREVDPLSVFPTEQNAIDNKTDLEIDINVNETGENPFNFI